MPTPLHRAGRRLADAVHLPVAVYLAYIGATALTLAPQDSLAGRLPDWLNLVWAIAITVGSVLVIYGTAADRTRAESSGHVFHLFGIGFYTLVHVVLGRELDDVPAVLVLAAVSFIRMRVLRRSRAARREAGRILHGRYR